MLGKIPKTNWIWLPEYKEDLKQEPVYVLFRKEYVIEQVESEMVIRISADTRYKLYINGRFVEYGPARGDDKIWYVDEINITPWLEAGKNTIAVEVLRFPVAERRGNFGMHRTTTPGLYIEEKCERENKIITDETWKCMESPERKARLNLWGLDSILCAEEWQTDSNVQAWTTNGFHDLEWKNACAYHIFQIKKDSIPGNLTLRTIPFMRKVNRKFKGIVPKYEEEEINVWNTFLHGEKSITIPAHTKIIMDIDAGEEMTGFVSLKAKQCHDVNVNILYSESYYQADGKTKTDREDYQNGTLKGDVKDVLTLSGENEILWSSYWYRTFRFIQFEIETGDEACELLEFSYQETGYPLEVKTKIQTSDPSFEGIWDISLRTLKRCMQETYLDCPYYEQLQYIMDTRSEILFTYHVSGDDRLARQAMEHFRHSQREDGLLNACYPYAAGAGVIPGFSIYYIMIVYDHMMYFGDKQLVRNHLGTIDGILNYFESHLDGSGLVEKIGGLLFADKYWSFIDWSTAWLKTSGVPTLGMSAPITMESMLYIYGLLHAAKLCKYVGRNDTASEYQARADKVIEAIHKNCRDKEGVYLDSPHASSYSIHCQIFAILNGMVSKETGKQLLETALENTEVYAQASVSMIFYLFRALEEVGMYDKSIAIWDRWRKMLDDHMTTCVENDTDQRSDCHAWGSLILYELPAVVLGVRPGTPGYETIIVDPHLAGLDFAKGSVYTPWGMVDIECKMDSSNRIKTVISGSDEVKKRIMC